MQRLLTTSVTLVIALGCIAPFFCHESGPVCEVKVRSDFTCPMRSSQTDDSSCGVDAVTVSPHSPTISKAAATSPVTAPNFVVPVYAADDEVRSVVPNAHPAPAVQLRI